jgi:serine/threonine protein phosphatase 1
MTLRTFVVGDIHGDLIALEHLLAKLPKMTQDDTLVFLGDYLDRGPSSLQVVERVRGLSATIPAKLVTLRGNHEDMWIRCYQGEEASYGFLMPPGNGCINTYRSFTGQTQLAETERLSNEELLLFMEVASWFPRELFDWMNSLPLWYEDEHAIYVHAGLEGEGTEWKHPKDCKPMPLMWMREEDFFLGYRGKRLVFGHTKVKDLPPPDLSFWKKLFDDPNDVWVNHDLIGLDTGSGKGGFLSAIELPTMKVYESR